MDVMALQDVAPIAVLQGRGGGRDGLEEDIDSQRKVRGKDEAGPGPIDPLAHLRHVVIPAGGSDNHIGARAGAGLDVFEHRMRRGEIDHRIHSRQGSPGERGPVRVLIDLDDLHAVSAFTGDAGHHRSGFARSKKYQVHVRSKKFNPPESLAATRIL